jgi:hypothetical protein
MLKSSETEVQYNLNSYFCVEYKQPKTCTCFEYIFWQMPLTANIDRRLCVNHSYTWKMSRFLVDVSRAYKIEFCKVNIADICHPRNTKECLPMLRKSDKMFFLYKIFCWNRDMPSRKCWNIKANIVRAKERKWVFFFLFAGPVLESEGCYPLTTQRNLDARKISSLKGSCIEGGCRKERCFVERIG